MSIFFIWCFLKMAFIYVGSCKGAKLYFFTDIWLIFVIDICDWFFFKTDICDWYFNWYMWMIFIILLIYLTDIWPIFLSDFCDWYLWVMFQEMKYVSEKLERLSHKGSADDLYDSIRQSSRGPMTGRQGNKLEMKGYLYIKKNSKSAESFSEITMVKSC